MTGFLLLMAACSSGGTRGGGDELGHDDASIADSVVADTDVQEDGRTQGDEGPGIDAAVDEGVPGGDTSVGDTSSGEASSSDADDDGLPPHDVPLADLPAEDDSPADAGTDADSSGGSPGPTHGFVAIQPGSFWMGSPDGTCPTGYLGTCAAELGRGALETLHYVTLTVGFEMSSFEITEGRFKEVMGWVNMGGYDHCDYGCGDNRPIKFVSWFDALAYANQLSTGAGKTPCYVLSEVMCEKGGAVGSEYMDCYDDDATGGGIDTATVALAAGAGRPQDCEGYRLPTEAEWEYAIRAGSTTALYPSPGNDGTFTVDSTSPMDPNLDQIAITGGSMVPYGTMPVGSREPNAWGLYDMSGNLREWVWDLSDEYPTGTVASPLVDPKGPDSVEWDWTPYPYRVTRGGEWLGNPVACRSAARSSNSPDHRTTTTGFRVVRSLP